MMYDYIKKLTKTPFAVRRQRLLTKLSKRDNLAKEIIEKERNVLFVCENYYIITFINRLGSKQYVTDAENKKRILSSTNMLQAFLFTNLSRAKNIRDDVLDLNVPATILKV